VTTQVSRYQERKTNLDFTEARDSEWQWHQLGHMQVSTSLHTDNHASSPVLSFYRPDALPATQPTVSKHWRPACCPVWLVLKSAIESAAEWRTRGRLLCSVDVDQIQSGSETGAEVDTEQSDTGLYNTLRGILQESARFGFLSSVVETLFCSLSLALFGWQSYFFKEVDYELVSNVSDN